MSIEEAKYLNPGQKLIFKRNGGGLSYRKGYIFTYLCHYLTISDFDKGRYIQLKECVDFGNTTSNADVRDLEIYDHEIHKGIEVTQEIMINNLKEFDFKFGVLV